MHGTSWGNSWGYSWGNSWGVSWGSVTDPGGSGRSSGIVMYGPGQFQPRIVLFASDGNGPDREFTTGGVYPQKT